MEGNVDGEGSVRIRSELTASIATKPAVVVIPAKAGTQLSPGSPLSRG
jgi:hypothetical protein